MTNISYKFATPVTSSKASNAEPVWFDLALSAIAGAGFIIALLERMPVH